MSALLTFAAITGSLVALASYKLSGTFYVTVSRLLGKQVIAVRGVSSAIRGDQWRSVIERGDWPGQLTAYRYPAMKLGALSLNADGTGYYCGNIEWRKL